MVEKNPRQGELARADMFDQEQQPSTLQTLENATIIDRHVVIGKGENGLFMVTVQPPLEGHEPQIFDTHKKARGHACGLRLVNRWAIHDEAEGVR